ncbi:Uncharacterized protein AO441_003049 [Nakaseomyces glabratus]|uniref:PSP1 C-terminal domain-containing protein n=1 Tax=Candida glabrata TaxID=5478 RepID=A0A0W0E678_CANGB|nr:Uncharacterized protein AO439_003196 [Nakaseomyces glabratus]KTB09053.1 Uncharacterized protein AO441_003049 [Nakaseomyces glabratus]KTB11221.1 Uncharacterized protein AO440_003130 [Nakaseomyces glabratus]KTB19651.1 Uncharacterized protein AO438_003203 [Nakaseomyces glabratus]
MELPSISSTTSISDNADLRNYYEKLLFKNSSGKSLTDLQNRAHRSNEDDENKERKFDFINGFKSNKNGIKLEQGRNRMPTFSGLKMTSMDTERKIPTSNFFNSQGQLQQQNHPSQNNNQNNLDPNSNGNYQDIFSNYNMSDKMGNGNDVSNSNSHSSPFSEFALPTLHKYQSNPGQDNMDYSNGNQSAGAWNNQKTALSGFEAQQDRNDGRRSSYISDTLIHGQYDIHNNPIPNGIAALRHHSSATGAMDPFMQVNPSQIYGQMPNQTATVQNTMPYGYKNTSNIIPLLNNLNLKGENNYNPQNRSLNNQRFPHQNNPGSRQGQKDIQQYPYNASKQQQDQYNSRFNHYNNGSNFENVKSSHMNDGAHQNTSKNHISESSLDFSICKDNYEELQNETGLLLLAGRQIVSTPKLHQFYLECGANYFSSKEVFKFADFIKEQLVITNDNENTSSSVLSFLDFLKSRNSNYFNKGSKQSNGEENGNLNENGNDPTNGGNASYKPLVLVALKNGKLELLSTPQTTNLLMKRGDLVIIDGDRGKDLVLVVEPSVDLNLALFVNFLKKKIHFDSLITNRNQHISNDNFIGLLEASKSGETPDINPKLYDVVELTELIIPSKQVLRFATPWEVSTNLHNKFQDELRAMHIARSKLSSLNETINGSQQGEKENDNSNQRSKMALNIKILNAEFQFDRKKLTFYYLCEERNDFRDLIKELFKYYKTRIWLCALPNNLEVDTKYYDKDHKELNMYQNMIDGENQMEVQDAPLKSDNSSVLAPPLNKLELDNFQIGVYKELVNQLFKTHFDY